MLLLLSREQFIAMLTFMMPGGLQLRLDMYYTPPGEAVKTGRRPPPEAARSGLDGCGQGATLDQVAFNVLLGHGLSVAY
ncbi:MAG TPA: hypothetical protein VKI44_07360 [Acetobacteraceae bacterium]|nr:hypothetical protein [Acetobacteraceae bacterium]